MWCIVTCYLRNGFVYKIVLAKRNITVSFDVVNVLAYVKHDICHNPPHSAY